MKIVGHRGAAGEAPENTVAALQHAITLGISCFEIDLRLSADEELVVLHDSSLLRTTGVNKPVTAVDTQALAKLTVYGRNGEQTTGVPTLRQLLDQCKPVDVIQLELKSDETTDKPRLVDKLKAFFPDAASTQPVVATSFDADLLKQLKAACPYMPIGLVSQSNTLQSLQQAIELECRYLCLSYKLVKQWDERTIDAINAANLHVSLWTVNEPDFLERIKHLPVNSIITDYPSRFI